MLDSAPSAMDQVRSCKSSSLAMLTSYILGRRTTCNLSRALREGRWYAVRDQDREKHRCRAAGACGSVRARNPKRRRRVQSGEPGRTAGVRAVGRFLLRSKGRHPRGRHNRFCWEAGTEQRSAKVSSPNRCFRQGQLNKDVQSQRACCMLHDKPRLTRRKARFYSSTPPQRGHHFCRRQSSKILAVLEGSKNGNQGKFAETVADFKVGRCMQLNYEELEAERQQSGTQRRTREPSNPATLFLSPWEKTSVLQYPLVKSLWNARLHDTDVSWAEGDDRLPWLRINRTGRARNRMDSLRVLSTGPRAGQSLVLH